MELVGGGAEAEARLALRHVERALEAKSKSRLEDIVQVRKNEHSTLVNVCTTYVFSLSIGTSLKIVVRLVRFCAIPSNQSPMSAMN